MENTTLIVEPEFGIYETYTKEQAVKVFERFFDATDLKYTKKILWQMFQSAMYDPDIAGAAQNHLPLMNYACHLEMITSVLTAVDALYRPNENL